MDYKVSFIASLVLFPLFLLRVLFTPWNVVHIVVHVDRQEWPKDFPDSEFIAFFTITILTLGIYSHLLNDTMPDRVLQIPEAFGINAPFGQASFWSLTLAILITWLMSYLWLLLTWSSPNRGNADRAGRVCFLVMMLYALSLILTTVRTRTIKQDASPALPETVVPIISAASYYCLALALLYFCWTAVAVFRRRRSGGDVS